VRKDSGVPSKVCGEIEILVNFSVNRKQCGLLKLDCNMLNGHQSAWLFNINTSCEINWLFPLHAKNLNTLDELSSVKGHVLPRHDDVSIALPTQYSPPNSGGGLVHVLTRVAGIALAFTLKQ